MSYNIDDSWKDLNIEPGVPCAGKLTYTQKSEIGKEIVLPFHELCLGPPIDGKTYVTIKTVIGTRTKHIMIDACEHNSFDIDEFKFVHYDPNSFCRKTSKYDKVVKTFIFKPIGCHEISCKKIGDKPATLDISFSISSVEIIDLKIGE